VELLFSLLRLGLYSNHTLVFIYIIMNRVKFFLVGLLTLLTVAVTHGQSLSFKEESIDVGLTQWYHPITATYVFTNKSGQPLTIQYVDPGCGCMEPEWTRGTIQPGGTGRVVVTYNAEMLGRFDRMIEVRNSLDAEPQLVRMKCKVVDHEVVQQKQVVEPEEEKPVVAQETPSAKQPLIDYAKPVMLTSTSSLIVGKFKPDKKLKGTLTISNRGDALLLVEKVEASGAVLVECPQLALKKNQTFKIKVWVDTAKMKDADDPQQFIIYSNDQISPKKIIKVVCGK